MLTIILQGDVIIYSLNQTGLYCELLLCLNNR